MNSRDIYDIQSHDSSVRLPNYSSNQTLMNTLRLGITVIPRLRKPISLCSYSVSATPKPDATSNSNLSNFATKISNTMPLATEKSTPQTTKATEKPTLQIKVTDKSTDSKTINLKSDKSTDEKISLKPESNLGSIYIISIPITPSKSYIYCNHKPAILTTQAQKYPLITKLETRAVTLALKLWTSISTSKNRINVKITELVKRLLATIRYEENCLKSFPSKTAMIREVNRENRNLAIGEADRSENAEFKGHLGQNQVIETKSEQDNAGQNAHLSPSFVTETGSRTHILQSQVGPLNLTPKDLIRIPFYHPTFQSPKSILTQLESYRVEGLAYHKKYALGCLIGIPICLPLALIPVMPNVPGFYLAYRLYCNVKALAGIKHLDYLVENEGKEHLEFKPLKEIDVNGEEGYLTEGGVDKLVDELKIGFLKEDLLRAIKQEQVNKGAS